MLTDKKNESDAGSNYDKEDESRADSNDDKEGESQVGSNNDSDKHHPQPAQGREVFQQRIFICSALMVSIRCWPTKSLSIYYKNTETRTVDHVSLIREPSMV